MPISARDFDKIWSTVRKYPNVIGYSRKVQRKIVNCKETGIPCIRIYVSKKLPREQIPKRTILRSGVIPSTMSVSSTVELPTDVIQQGEIRAAYLLPKAEPGEIGRTVRWRPAFAGISGGHSTITAGTLGQPVIHPNFGPGWLSNWHIWKGLYGNWNDNVLQPGKYDGGQVPADEFAKLMDGKIVVPSPSGSNKVDVCYAQTLTPEIYTKDIARHSVAEKFQAKGVEDIKQGDMCFFTGRTTPYGEGPCVDDAWSGNVNYGDFYAFYTDMLVWSFNPNIQGGNSGSPVYKIGDIFGALIFAGSDTDAIGMKWKNILEVMPGLTVDTGPGPQENRIDVTVNGAVVDTIPTSAPGTYTDEVESQPVGPHMLGFREIRNSEVVDFKEVRIIVDQGETGITINEPQPDQHFQPGEKITFKITVR
jgi:hypothetical protein